MVTLTQTEPFVPDGDPERVALLTVIHALIEVHGGHDALAPHVAGQVAALKAAKGLPADAKSSDRFKRSLRDLGFETE
jgi:hypothetical protein